MNSITTLVEQTLHKSHLAVFVYNLKSIYCCTFRCS